MPQTYEDAIAYLADQMDTSEDMMEGDWESDDECFGSQLGGEWALMAFIYGKTEDQVIADVVRKLEADGYLT